MNSRGFSLLFIVFGVVLVFGLVTAGFYLKKDWFFKSTNLSSQSQYDGSPKQLLKAPEIVSLKDDLIQTAKQFNFKKPNKYLYHALNRDLVLANLNDSAEFQIVKSKGKWDWTEDIAVSPNGQYVTFITLSQDVVAGYENNPPSEFHGSEDYELWIANITNPQKPMLTKIQDKIQYTLNQDSIVSWDDDSKGFYYHDKDRGMLDNSNKNFFYSISESKAKQIDGDIIDDQLTSPNNEEYIFSDLKSTPTSNNLIFNRTYDLSLYKKDSQSPVRSLIKKDYSTKIVNYEGKTFVFDESYTNNVFLTNNYIIYNYSPSRDGRYFSINLESVNTQGQSQVIDNKLFDANGEYGFSDYTFSPNGKYLVAKVSKAKSDDKIVDQIFVYNPNTQDKRYMVTRGHCLKNYYWYSATEIIVNIDKDCSSSEDSSIASMDPVILNIETGAESVFTKLVNKNPVVIF